MGTNARASSDAIEVIANVMPVRLRIEELCIREFARIICDELTGILIFRPVVGNLGIY